MKFLPFYCNYIVVCDNIILHKLLGKLGAKMKKFTGFLAIFMVVLLCVPSFTAVFADTYSSSVSTVQDGNESESSTDNTTDNVQTYPYDLEEGIYKIKYQNKVLTGVSSEQNGGQTFIFADEQESDEQLFCFEKLEQDKYKIVQQSSQKVLTAQDNTAVFSDWNDDETQYWSLVSTEEETVFLKSYNHQMVVVSSENTLQLSYNMPNESFSFERAVNSYSTNSNVENTVDSQEKQTLNSAQQKDVVIPDGYYEIRSAVSGKNLEVYGVSTLGGAKITQWYATGGKNQKWKVENQADGSVRITNVNSGLVLDYNGSVNAYEQWDWHGGSNQRWEISKTSTEGNYCIRNQSNGYAMDVLYGAMEDGDHVVSYEYNGGVNQQWQFIKTDCNATQVVPDGYYEIKSAVSGKDLEVYGASLLGGGKVTQWDATGGNNQKWKLENQSDGTIRLTNVNSGLVLDYNASTNSYEQWDWHGGSNQRWQISKSQAGNYYIRNMSNNHAMDVLYGSMNNGQYVVDYEYNGGINQQWQLVPTKIEQVMPDGYYEIRSAVSGKNLEVYGVSTQGGAKITQWDATGGNNQKWKLENQSDGTIRLTNVNSGLVLDYNASTNSYEQWDWHGGSNQRWQISKSQAGNYYIRNMSNNHAMDVLYGSMNNGQYVVDYEYNGGINQQWQLVPVELKTLQGIDVSEHQGNINWQQVKASGQVDFAIIRAGYGRETYQKDKFFEQNYAGAKAQNIPIGIYQYSYADSVADAEREAETCLTWLNGRAVDSYVIFDFEESKIIDKLNKDDIPDNDITPDVLSQMAIAWCKKIEAAGYTPMIYVNPDFITNKYNYKMLKESGYDIWIANYGRSITYDWPYPVRMWQYTSSGSVSGISTNVDMNIMYTGSEYSGKFVLPDGQKGKCNSSNVNVRTSPTTTSGNNVLFQVHNGYQFTILQEQNGWYQVSFGADRIGWISGLYVTLI